MTLHGFQVDAIDRLRERLRTDRRVVFSAPTGSGKTVMALEMARRAVENGNRVLFIADRVTLVDQTQALFEAAGVRVGRWQAETTKDTDAQVVIASAATLEARNEGQGFDLCIADEVHVRRCYVEERIVKQSPCAVGLSATPFAPGLIGPDEENPWRSMVVAATTRQLWDEGYLVEPAVHVEHIPDMAGAAEQGGEWTADAAERATAHLGRTMASRWIRLMAEIGHPPPTLIIGATVQHCRQLCEAMRDATGMHWDTVSYQEGHEYTRAAVRRFKSGETIGLASVSKLAIGFDAPGAECLIHARPLKKGFMPWLQSLGRIYRTAEGKDGAWVLDYSGCSTHFYSRTVHAYETGRDVGQEEDGSRKPFRGPKGVFAIQERSELTAKICGRCKAIQRNRAAVVCERCGAPCAAVEQDTSIKDFRPPGQGRVLTSPWMIAQVLASRRWLQHDDMELAKRTARAIHHGLTGSWKRRTTHVEISEEMAQRRVDPATEQRVKESWDDYRQRRPIHGPVKLSPDNYVGGRWYGRAG